ncbi:hypothetical protein F5Y18DRAFT_438657 [Xylariaceae sp. FL1019]|nr:hypothetical protein F5Y18DRAFT_438657 [Xylariaceae sp. FL1019]
MKAEALQYLPHQVTMSHVMVIVVWMAMIGQAHALDGDSIAAITIIAVTIPTIIGVFIGVWYCAGKQTKVHDLERCDPHLYETALRQSATTASYGTIRDNRSEDVAARMGAADYPHELSYGDFVHANNTMILLCIRKLYQVTYKCANFVLRVGVSRASHSILFPGVDSAAATLGSGNTIALTSGLLYTPNQVPTAYHDRISSPGLPIGLLDATINSRFSNTSNSAPFDHISLDTQKLHAQE